MLTAGSTRTSVLTSAWQRVSAWWRGREAWLGKLDRWLFGSHPNNTILNYNWAVIRPLIRDLKKSTKYAKGTMVDVGAGHSPYFELFRDHVDRFLASDLEAVLPRWERKGVDRIPGDIHDLPLGDNSVDTVLCTQVLSHIRSPEKAFDEFARVLRPGGHAIISVMHAGVLQVEPYDYRRMTPFYMHELARGAGMESVELTSQGGVFTTFAVLLAMNLALSPLGRGPMRLVRRRRYFFAPLIGTVNLLAWVLDRLFPLTRCPTNLVFIARKTDPACT